MERNIRFRDYRIPLHYFSCRKSLISFFIVFFGSVSLHGQSIFSLLVDYEPGIRIVHVRPVNYWHIHTRNELGVGIQYKSKIAIGASYEYTKIFSSHEPHVNDVSGFGFYLRGNHGFKFLGGNFSLYGETSYTRRNYTSFDPVRLQGYTDEQMRFGMGVDYQLSKYWYVSFGHRLIYYFSGELLYTTRPMIKLNIPL